MSGFLHGVEVVEIQDGLRPISTVRSSVIGLVGTAPDAVAAATAAVSTGVEANNNGLTFSANSAGFAGNAISVMLLDPKANSAALAVTVKTNAITVSLATDAGGVITTTAAQIITAIAANAQAAALITAANTGASTGAAVVTATVKPANLAGGVDEAFPLNTPVLIAGKRSEAAGLDSTGNGKGTLVAAMDDIFDQAGALVVVIRVADDVLPANVKANVIGGVDVNGNRTGLQALLDAKSKVHLTPKILVAPGFTDDQAVVADMIGIADSLKAVIIADGPNTTDAAAITYRGNFGSRRVYIVDPWIKRFDVATASEVISPASARVAGMIARSDNERGYWWSPSNTMMNGIIGTARPVDFALGDTTARANLLNEQEVATIIHEDGYRLWGNRTCSADPKFAFLNVTRVNDMINESILLAHLWAVDRNITKTYVEDVLAGINAYLDKLTATGAILGGKAWLDQDLNTPAEIAQGHVYFDYDFTPPYPAERITMRSHLVNDYITEVTKA